jgi:4-hydroxy-L-threonine phosphate dehydrogenase PdxA
MLSFYRMCWHFNIASKNQADPGSMNAAIKLAVQMAGGKIGE